MLIGVLLIFQFLAWLSVVGGFAGQFCAFGYLNIVGVFLAYYHTHQLADLSPADISWIGSAQSFVCSASGLLCGRVCDMYGPRILAITGTFMLPFGILLSAFCTHWIEFMIVQSFIVPLGAAMLFYSTTASMSSWFVKKRGVAFGIATTGSSIGGVVMSYVFDQLSTQKSYQRAVFALAMIQFCVACVTIPSSTIRMQVVSDGRRSFDFRNNFVKPFLNEPVFALFTLSMSLTYLGIFVPYAYMASHALHIGVPLDRALHVVTAMSAGSLFGRVAAGAVADIRSHSRKWQFSTSTGVAACASLTCFPLWFASRSENAVVFTAAVYGAASGGVLALYPSVVARISPAKDIGSRVGAMSFVMAFGSLVSLPIAGGIVGRTEGGGFGGLQFYAASALAGGAIVCFIAGRKSSEGAIRLGDEDDL
ncbi:major facilitator superfamily domain-containing protein [Kockiozyma suomiensis]|uniref:major facilitator superfamily domain-containing protein n=1 Tax=Kockiozyma suomiensis TaxID=1337062 RepID=UPI003343154B